MSTEVELFIAFLLAIAGVIGVMWARGTRASRRPDTTVNEERRFLCPYCLHFGDVEMACGVCRDVITVFQTPADGYVGYCSQCGTTMSFQDGPDGLHLWAYCVHCRQVASRDVYHNKHVRVLGVLDTADLDVLTRAGHRHRDETHAIIEDGEQLTYILDFSRFPDITLSATHAINALEAIWLDAASQDALELGRHLDRLIRWAGMSSKLMDSVTFCLRQSEMDHDSQKRLEATCQSVELGVSAEDFLNGRFGAGWPPAGATQA
jgi:hypothetical protein